jgi:hypothetical protein
MTISQATAFLESAFSALNKEYFENALPTPAITIQSSPKSYGHCSRSEYWTDAQRKTAYYEINIGAEFLNRPIAETIVTLVHEMVHLYHNVNGIQGVSRGGTYHNKRFKEDAEKRGLQIDYDAKIGFSITRPAPSLKTFCTSQHWRNKLTIARMGEIGGNEPKPKKPSSTRKYECPCCGQSIRATKDVNIMCMDCEQPMTVAS